LNQEGYWLYDRHQEREWGFMFEDTAMSVPEAYPDIWRLITEFAETDPQFNVLQDHLGLLSVQRWRYTPRILLKGHNEFLMPWTAVAYYSPEKIQSLYKDLQQRYMGLLLVSAIPILSLSVGFAVLFRRREELSRNLNKLEEMREADKKFRTALDASPTPMIMVDQEQNIVLANREALKLFEFSSADEMNIPLTSLIPNQVKKRHIHLVEEFQASPEERRMAPIREVQAITHTGKEIAVEIGLNPVSTSDGIVTLASITDITQRKQLESQLAKSNRTMMLAINTARVGVWTWIVGEDAMMWDDRMYKIYDFVQRPLKPITYQEWREKIHPEDVARVDRVFERALRSNESQQYEFRVYTKDGQICWIKGGVVRELAGNMTRLVGINIDVTEERMSHQSIATINRELERRVTQRTQELQQANRELEAFSYAVSHDLRTPLRGIDGFSNLLLKSLEHKIEGKDKEYLFRIRTAAQRMGDLIDDMLTLSRITRADVVRKRVDLSALGKNIMDNWRELEPNRAVEFVVPQHLYANADSALMRIVLNNLLSNAWKFTSKVHNAIIELGHMTTPEGEVFFVKDNGAGFDMEYVNKLFGPFQRLHTNSEFPGNGIGLATVQRVIEKHDGKVWAEGYVDRGATFFFTLP
ncbi:MAG TPA: PAS domain S-box protein, partial [Pseudomonadales bacterium]|nr:PAS domain S-box protein [Pseudomonadales bacterium]